MSERRNLVLRCVLVCGAAIAAAMVLVAPVPVDAPVSWSGDALEHAVLVDSANWMGEPGFSEETGAPHGVDWAQTPSGGERLPLAVMAVLRDATGSIWTAINLHMLAAIAATALASFLVLRWMGAGDLFAGATAVVFALGSPVFDHIELGHLFLFALYPVPIALYLACRWSGWSPARGSGTVMPLRSEVLLSAGCVVVVGLSSTYYALFAALIIGALAVAVAVRRKDWRRALPGLACAAATAAVVLASSLPRLLDADSLRLERKLSDSIRFALDPIGMLLPQRENLTGLTGWGSSPAEAIGLAATVGLGWLAWVLLRRLRRGSGGAEGLLLRLAAVVGVGLAVGVPGGIGWLIARAGGQELRAWSRVSVFIGFAGLAALAVLVNRHMATRPVPRYLVPATVALVLLALLEQRSVLPDRTALREAEAAASAVVEDMESSLEEGSQVLVLPAGSYLNDFGPGETLALPLLGERLRYSSGSFRGGSGDWQLSWALEPVESQLEAAAAGGFDAVVVQADHHRLEDPDELVRAVDASLGEPSGVEGAWIWWDLEPLASELETLHGRAGTRRLGEVALRPLGIVVEGTPGFPSTGAERDYVVGESSSIRVLAHDDVEAPVVVALDLRVADGSEVELSWVGPDGRRSDVLAPGPDGEGVVVEVATRAGEAGLHLEVRGDAMRRGGDDPDVWAELRDVQAFDARLGEQGFAVPAPLR